MATADVAGVLPAAAVVVSVSATTGTSEGVHGGFAVESATLSLRRVAVDTYDYDGAGRMTSRTVGSVTTALGWDPLSNLTSTSSLADSRIYAYDASGQRVAQIVVNAVAANPVASKVTAYIGDLEVTDADVATTGVGLSATRYFTFGGATVATVTSGSPTPTWSLMLGDGQGSAQVAMELVPQASGTGLAPASSTHAVTRNAYLPFGATRGGDNLATSRGWLGQVADTDTGLIYLNARYYDPVLARFVSPDPLMNPGDPKTLDPYRYADNNPVMMTDASGLEAVCAKLSGNAMSICNMREQNARIWGTDKRPNKKVQFFLNTTGSPWTVSSGSSAVDRQARTILRNQTMIDDLEAGRNPYAKPTPKGKVEALHIALDTAGLAPGGGEFFDLANGVIYLGQGQKLNAALSFGAAIPLAGWGFTGVKWLKPIVKSADEVAPVAKNAVKAADCSFEGDTKVLMADGSTKPIGDIKPGDRVMAEDPETGERGPRTVTHVWVHGDDLVDFRIADDVVTTTEDHPFWNATDRQWEGPEEFDAGDRVLTADGNLLVTRGLVADSWHTGSAYNLTVNDIHTFYVVVANEAVLVHNCPPFGQFDDMLPGVNPGNLKKLNDSQIERIVGQPAHAFKTEILGDKANIKLFDIAKGDDGMLYLIRQSDKTVVETGVSAIG